MKTVWLFYHILKTRGAAPLYAFTDKKKYAKEFQSVRDMNLFKVEKIQLSNDDFYKFMSKHRKLIMAENIYETKDFPLSICRTKQITIVGPEAEDSTVFSLTMELENDLGCHTNLNTKYLKDSYQQTLNFFHYFDMLAFNPHLKVVNDPYFASKKAFLDLIGDIDGYDFHQYISSSQFKPDTLLIFLNRFGWSMKVKK
jgi:hypothetical protein